MQFGIKIHSLPFMKFTGITRQEDTHTADMQYRGQKKRNSSVNRYKCAQPIREIFSTPPFSLRSGGWIPEDESKEKHGALHTHWDPMPELT
jgi:hypothetical protein